MKAIGKYQVLQEIGSSAAAKLFRARDKFRNWEVALKVYDTALTPQAEADELKAKDQFCHELGACADLSHLHLATILDVGESDGVFYVATELLTGVDLAGHFQQRRAKPLTAKLEWIAQVCDALSVVHHGGIAHGNLKPSNLFLAAGEDIRILDLGTGRWITSILAAGGRLPGLGVQHFAPEQILGEYFDARSDIFSVGVILYQLLTDKYPFPGVDAVVPREIVHTDPKPLRQLDPQFPEELEQLLIRALHKDPQQRVQTVGEFATRLRRIANPVVAASVPLPAQQPPAKIPPAAAKPPSGKQNRGKKQAVTYTVGGLLALGLTGMFLSHGGMDGSPNPLSASSTMPTKPIEAPANPVPRPVETKPVAAVPAQPSEDPAKLATIRSLWESGQYEQGLTVVNDLLAKNPESAGAKFLKKKIRAAQQTEAALK